MTDDLAAIQTKEALADFVFAMRQSLREKPDEWENPTLESFLEAMDAWLRVMDAYARNTGDSEVLTPSWQTFAKILSAAQIYE